MHTLRSTPFSEKDLPVMNTTARFIISVLTVLLALFLSGCAPEVGSDKWCANLKEKPKGEWSLNETTDYAKHCLMK